MPSQVVPLREPTAAAVPVAARPAPPRRVALRVLMVVESSSGGTGRHVLDLSEGLARRGCDVHVLYGTRRTDRFFLDRVNTVTGVTCVPLPMRTSIHPSDFLAVRAARRYLSDLGHFDVIHGHSSKGGAVARLAALGRGLPALYTLHGFIVMDPSLARWKRLFYLLIEMALSLRTANIIAVAPEERREAVRMGLGKGRVTLVPNGVAPADLTPRGRVRHDMRLEEDVPLVGFVGRFVPQKAPDLLVHAMKRVAERVPRARLAMVGTGALEEDVRRLAWEVGLADRVLWLGERPAASVLAAFDVFAMPSHKEGMPYVVLEAMAAGLPVVATNSSGVGSLVETGSNGIVVPRGDAGALGDALAALASDPDLRRRYGGASLERIKAFTIDRMVDQTLGAYEAALGRAALTPALPPAPTGLAGPTGDLELAAAGPEVEPL